MQSTDVMIDYPTNLAHFSQCPFLHWNHFCNGFNLITLPLVNH